MKIAPVTCFLFVVFSITTLQLSAQIGSGQFLLNGDLSFFNNRDKTERNNTGRTINGELVPAYDYVLQQYASNLTLNPRIHYFLSEKWSVGISFGFRQIITKRFVNTYVTAEASEYVAFSVPPKVQNTTYSYSPNIEVARHWMLSERIVINLTGTVNWRWVVLNIKEEAPLDLTKVSELTSWDISSNGLEFSPKNQEVVKEKSKEQFWTVGVSPQLRYAVTPRFGFTATLGGVELSQKVKDDDVGFKRAAPGWSVRVNPNSWILGVYGVF